MIEALRGKRGDVREILGRVPSDEDLLDLSQEKWDGVPEVLNHLTFSRVRLADSHINVDFADCVFENSRFERVTSEGHFWSRGTRWRGCDFVGVAISLGICPGNVFDHCLFDAVALTAFRPASVTFRACHFRNLAVDGMRAVLPAGLASTDSEGHLGNVVFVDCVFERPRFRNCEFAGIQFLRCRVIDPDVEASNFDGVMWDHPWHTVDAGREPFLAFLEELLAFARDHFGTTSKSYLSLSAYADAYRTGKAPSRDYSAVLYSGDVPDAELDVLEDAIDSISVRYPL